MSARALKLCLYFALCPLIFFANDLSRTESHSAVQSATQFKFPWPQGDWEYRQGWHGPGNNALDIGTRGQTADKRVLAAADGTITNMCLGARSARVVIDHSGTTLEYWHLDVKQLGAGIAMNERVVQGQVLGVLLSGAFPLAGEPADGCGQAPDQVPDSAHLHWVIPGNTSFSVDGWTIDRGNNTFRRGAEVRNPHACDNCPYDYLHSTNVPSARVEVAKTGDGGGSITSSPAGISCGSDCDGGYPLGSSLTLIASPSAGAAFAGWGGACSGSGTSTTCVVSINSSKTVTASFRSNATFTLQTQRLMGATASGIITGSGINCPGACNKDFPAGTVVTLTATPASGSAFDGWSGDCTGTSPCTVTMNRSRSVSASFITPQLGKAMLTVSKAGNGRGWVDAYGQGINCSNDCTEQYQLGTVVHLRASPEPGSNFTGWSGPCQGASEYCDVTMDTSKLLTATFTSIYEPAPKATLVSPNTLISSRWPDFIWEAHNFKASYRLELSPANDPKSVIFSAGPYSSDSLCSSQNNLCTLTSPRVLANGSYAWRVHSTNLDNSQVAPSVSDDMLFRVVGAPCTYTVVPTSPTDYGVKGGTGTIQITTQPHCYWVTNSYWWAQVSQGSGQGSATIDYRVFPNCSPQFRSGNVSVRGLDSGEIAVPVTVMQNKTFAVNTFYPSKSFYNVNSGEWLAGDFNGDGRGDLAHLTESSYMHPWISHGDGTFDVLQFNFRDGYNTHSGIWLPGDFDKDGLGDLAHVTDGNWVNFWFSNGNGTFTEKPWQGSPTYRNRPGQWLAGDFDGDGRTDLVHMLQSTYMHTWLARGNRKWDVQTFTPGDGRYAVYLGHFVAGDFNGDGRKDLIHFVGSYIHTWLSTGHGRFNVLKAFTPWPDYGYRLGHFQVGDIDRDGDDDLIHITGLHYVHPWISRGDGTFDVKFFSPGAGYATSEGVWLAGDFDADGKMDLLHHTGYIAHPWMSKGDGTFALSTICPNPLFGYNERSGRWIRVDLNGDRKTDWVHLVNDTYVHPWISGADQTTYLGSVADAIFAAPGVSSCPNCAIPPEVTVWANTASGLYHCRGQRLYGKTKRGLFMTQKQARDIGFRAAYKRICRN